MVCVVVSLGCSPEASWEMTLQAGQQALGQGKEQKEQEAVRLLSAAVSQAEAFGKNDARLELSLSNLAQAYAMYGKYVEAEPLLKRSLAIKEKLLGATHPEVALGLRNLAILYQVDGRLDLAEGLFKKLLAVREKALGPDHPEMANSLDDLASLLRKAKREQEADALPAKAAGLKTAASLPTPSSGQ